MSRLLKFKLSASGPKGSVNVLLLRPPGSSWDQLGRKIASKFGLVPVSADYMIA
jgi:hypothetical protein